MPRSQCAKKGSENIRQLVKEHETATGGQWVRFGYVDFTRVYAERNAAVFLGDPVEGTRSD